MCRSFCMVCPELLLYWLFYNNKRSQNVADKKPVNLAFYSNVLAAFYFMTELIWIVVNVFCSGVNTAGSE